jgi:hypothetical protein
MSGLVAASVMALALSHGSLVEPQPPPPATVFDQARLRQTFYPVGSLEGDGMKMAYYVMGGPLSDRKAAGQSAVLVNLKADKGLVQVVELQAISCADGRLTPTFRMMFDADGTALASSGPVQKEAPETLLSPDAARRTIDFLCHGVEPKNALTGRTLIEIR